jgi:multisubunit Na+/H+ antiporter MnhG subunit
MEPNTRVGLSALSVLLLLCGALLIAQSRTDSLVVWLLFVVVALTTFVVGVVVAAATTKAHTAQADAAKLDELEPLPPVDDSDRP